MEYIIKSVIQLFYECLEDVVCPSEKIWCYHCALYLLSFSIHFVLDFTILSVSFLLSCPFKPKCLFSKHWYSRTHSGTMIICISLKLFHQQFWFNIWKTMWNGTKEIKKSVKETQGWWRSANKNLSCEEYMKCNHPCQTKWM